MHLSPNRTIQLSVLLPYSKDKVDGIGREVRSPLAALFAVAQVFRSDVDTEVAHVDFSAQTGFGDGGRRGGEWQKWAGETIAAWCFWTGTHCVTSVSDGDAWSMRTRLAIVAMIWRLAATTTGARESE